MMRRLQPLLDCPRRAGLISDSCSSSPSCRHRLPSDSTSRWTPLPRRAADHLGPQRTCTSETYDMPGAQRRPADFGGPCSFVWIKYYTVNVLELTTGGSGVKLLRPLTAVR